MIITPTPSHPAWGAPPAGMSMTMPSISLPCGASTAGACLPLCQAEARMATLISCLG